MAGRLLRRHLSSLAGGPSLAGVWKVSVTPQRAGIAPAGLWKHMPKRLRLAEAPASTVEVPYKPCCTGGWALAPGGAEAEGAQRATITLTCVGGSEAGAGAGPHTLLLSGLFDGERIAGTVRAESSDTTANFICTRLFTFWGPPSPRAARKVPTGPSAPRVGDVKDRR